MPRAAEIEVELCPVSKASYWLSSIFRKAADALILAQGVELLPPAGNKFMGIGLMADIPDQLVIRAY